MGNGGLEGTITCDRRSDHDENVGCQSDRGDPNDDRGDSKVDRPKVPREGIHQEKQGRLEHRRKALHGEVELPRDHSTKLTLTASAFVDFGTPDFGLAEAV